MRILTCILAVLVDISRDLVVLAREARGDRAEDGLAELSAVLLDPLADDLDLGLDAEDALRQRKRRQRKRRRAKRGESRRGVSKAPCAGSGHRCRVNAPSKLTSRF